MANTQTGPIQDNYVDKRRGRDWKNQVPAEYANMASITTLRARLTALSATTYTAAVLDKMTVNDMVYALRTLADSAGIK